MRACSTPGPDAAQDVAAGAGVIRRLLEKPRAAREFVSGLHTRALLPAEHPGPERSAEEGMRR